jgi:biopolymer transport protein ExbB
LISIIQAAGWPIWPLIACSVVALALVLERLFALRPRRVAPPTLTDEVIGVLRGGLPAPDIVAKLADNSPLGGVLAAGIRHAATDPAADDASLRQAFEMAGRDAARRLERYLNALATIASMAPLMGLLGTVIGMIEIFAAQDPAAGGSPALVARGISIALYNTAFGLMIAIPALVFYRYFRGVVDAQLHAMEQAADRLMPPLMALLLRRATRAEPKRETRR